MKKLWIYVVAAFVAFFIVTNPAGAATVALDIVGGIGEFASTVVGGAQ